MVHRRHTRKSRGLQKTLKNTVNMSRRVVTGIGRLVTGSVRVVGKTGMAIVKKTDTTLRKMIPKGRGRTRRHRRR